MSRHSALTPPGRSSLQRLQHHDAGDYLGWDRRVASTLAGQIPEYLGREQLVAVVGKQRMTCTAGGQVVWLLQGAASCCSRSQSEHPGLAPSAGSKTTTGNARSAAS